MSEPTNCDAAPSATEFRPRLFGPALSEDSRVRVWRERVVIPTYLPAAPDLNPMFLEKRVYQGSSGKVYPLPFTDRIAETKTDRDWVAVWIENEYLRVMILPELGGRIHVAQDKTNGYDFVYRQPVIKPALVGLAGPWISGGIEFNWPQHHRPSTYLPADVEIEEAADGSKTVWLSDHDPLCRMKGMHGVCLHPGKAFLEVKVRAYNRTPFAQTFLWWANAGVRVHEGYQSFFPPDTTHVADHARRATSDYPFCGDYYYGVNYGERRRKGVPVDEQPRQFLPPHSGGKGPVNYRADDLSWYANIPTPCSYMCMGTSEDFFGGYDHFQQAGIVHVANHQIAPGKKQWTWGNHDLGYAWDRHLSDDGGPYIELMAGVYTDNQPDFSFLQPGETKTWSQYWFPIQKIGVAHHANLEASVNLTMNAKTARVGVSVSGEFPGAKIRLEGKGGARLEWEANLMPGKPFVAEKRLAGKKWAASAVTLRVFSQSGKEVIAYAPKQRSQGKAPPPAREPLAPEKVKSPDELYLAGLHLQQYRHATRCPTIYWRDALRRDPLDSRCNNAMGLWRLRRGEFFLAAKHFQKSIERLTQKNANPYDGEPFYNLGLALRYQLDAGREPAAGLKIFEDAYSAFYKATWNQAWQAASYHALAEMDCKRGHWCVALDHLDRSLRLNTDNLRARDLKAIVLHRLGQSAAAEIFLRETLALDPHDWWARHLLGQPLRCDGQVRLDLALDFAQAGFYREALELLEDSPTPTGARFFNNGDHRLPTQDWGCAPMRHYYLGWFNGKLGNKKAEVAQYREAAAQPSDYCFPSRLEEIGILEAAMLANSRDARAPYYLGNLFYDRGRHTEALKLWEQSAKMDPSSSVVWRNLGIARFNIAQKPAAAKRAYDRAYRAKPTDARVLYERDQLWKRTGSRPQKRLRELEKRPALAAQRDDLTIELCALYNQTRQHEKALRIITKRRFQPWEGGEGEALAQHVRTHLALGRVALAGGDSARARSHFETALAPPPNLGEAKHLLANQSDLYYWLGVACDSQGDAEAAKKYWLNAAKFRGDFQEMRARAFSEMTYFSACAWGRLGKMKQMKKLLRELLAYAKTLEKAEAKIDYFATSLPAMLLFNEDVQLRQETKALFLQAQAQLGLGKKALAKRLLAGVLKRDPNHPLALDLLETSFPRQLESRQTIRPVAK